MNLIGLAGAINVHGFLHCNELHRLVELACNRDVLEIGSFRGLSAWGMGLTAKTLTCVDRFSATSDGVGESGNVTTLRDFLRATARYSQEMMLHYVGTSERAVVDIEGSFDMIFVDGDHSYNGVKSDIERWGSKLRPGGIWAFHDYAGEGAQYPGVKQAVDEKFGIPEDVCVTLRVVKT